MESFVICHNDIRILDKEKGRSITPCDIQKANMGLVAHTLVLAIQEANAWEPRVWAQPVQFGEVLPQNLKQIFFF